MTWVEKAESNMSIVDSGRTGSMRVTPMSEILQKGRGYAFRPMRTRSCFTLALPRMAKNQSSTHVHAI